MRNRNIRPTGKWRNNQLISNLWQRGNTYCAAAREVRKKKHRRARSVQPAPCLGWQKRRAGFLVLLFFVLLFCYLLIFTLCAHRGTNDFTCFPHWGAAPAPKTRRFGRQRRQHRSSKGRERSDLTTWSPSTHVLSTSMQSWLHTLLASCAFVAGKTKPSNH